MEDLLDVAVGAPPAGAPKGLSTFQKQILKEILKKELLKHKLLILKGKMEE